MFKENIVNLKKEKVLMVLMIVCLSLLSCSLSMDRDQTQTRFNENNELNHKGFGSLSGKRICIDPGHGGKQSGAVGRMSVFGGKVIKLYEKNMTLTFAEAVKEALEDEGATVIMTRTNDSTVGVNDRYKLATRKKVDAFISIHFDYIKGPAGVASFYGQRRTHDKYFAQIMHKAVVSSTGNKSFGVKSDVYTAVKFCGVLNYGGNYPRVLIEANNNDYLGLQGFEFAAEGSRFARGIVRGLKTYFED